MRTPDKTLIKHLNTILKNELTAINQYFLHSRMLKNMGYNKLGDYEYQESIDEMKHADQLIERILFLGGLPNLQDLGKLRIGETVEEMLDADYKMELANFKDLQEAFKYADDQQDAGSAELLASIVSSEEEHILWLEQQLGQIKDMGIENYLQSQV